MADLEHKKEKTEAGKESPGSHILSGDVLELPLHIAKKVVNALVEDDDELSAEGGDNILDNVSEALTSVEDVIEEHVEEIAESAVKVAEVLGDTISDIEVQSSCLCRVNLTDRYNVVKNKKLSLCDFSDLLRMKKELVWKVSPFEELTINELYEILHLRCKIFVVEQDAPYLDTDYKDQKALHLSGYADDRLVAYCRIFKAGDYFEEACIGRVIVAQEYRKYGYGHDMMKKALNIASATLGETRITISAQQYLQKFYESHGFRQTSEMYLEDGLPHIEMKKEQNFLKSLVR